MVPDAWCSAIDAVVIDSRNGSSYTSDTVLNYAAYSDACLRAQCVNRAWEIYQGDRYIGGSPILDDLCNRYSKREVAIAVWSVFGACMLAIIVVGLVSKACNRNGRQQWWICGTQRDATSGLRALWAAVAPLVLLGGLVADVVTDVLQFYSLLPNKFAYLLLLALFLPTVVVGGIWHIIRPAARPGACGLLWRLLTAPVMAPASGLWLNGLVICAMAANLLRRRPMLHRPPWLAVDIPKYAHVFNVFTVLLEDTLSSAFSTAAYLMYDKSVLGAYLPTTVFVLSLASSMAHHVLVYTWLLKDALLRGSGSGCCSMLKTLVDLAPAAEQQDRGDEP
jgi:hypothetical protein